MQQKKEYVCYTDTIPGDSVAYPVRDTAYIPKLVYRDTGNVRWRESKIDTLAILSDYFARLAYSDTAKNDSDALIVVNDIITQNKIFERQVWYQNRRPTAINNTYVSKSRNRYYFGVMTGYNKNFEAGPSFTYITKKDLIINYGYDLLKSEHSVRLFLPLIPRQRDPPP